MAKPKVYDFTLFCGLEFTIVGQKGNKICKLKLNPKISISVTVQILIRNERHMNINTAVQSHEKLFK